MIPITALRFEDTSRRRIEATRRAIADVLDSEQFSHLPPEWQEGLRGGPRIGPKKQEWWLMLLAQTQRRDAIRQATYDHAERYDRLSDELKRRFRDCEWESVTLSLDELAQIDRDLALLTSNVPLGSSEWIEFMDRRTTITVVYLRGRQTRRYTGRLTAFGSNPGVKGDLEFDGHFRIQRKYVIDVERPGLAVAT